MSCLGVDPGTSNIGVAWITHATDAPAAHAAPLQWALRGAWQCSLHAVGKDACAAGPDALDAVIAAAVALRAPRGAPCVLACIERQPNAMANPTVRMTEAAVHGVLAAAMPRAARVHQDGRVKNTLVDALLRHMAAGAATLKFRKVPRCAVWHADDGDGHRWCSVTLAASDDGDAGGAACTLGSIPPRDDAKTAHMQLMDPADLIPGARKRARGAADARADRRSAEDAKWRANKSHGEAAATALLCYRAVHGRDRSATKALEYMAVLDSAHRHDVCDALLHAVAGAWAQLGRGNGGSAQRRAGGGAAAAAAAVDA